MAKANKQQEDYAAELEKSLEHWEHLRVYGGQDPFYSDGVNMNLVHNHICCCKRKIEETMEQGEYPPAYYRETPPEVDQNYMARAEEIRANAQKVLEMYKVNPDYLFLCGRASRLTDKQKNNTHIDSVIGYVSGLEAAVTGGDLITMRRHERTGGYFESFADCAERVRNIKPPQNEQMTLFAYGKEERGVNNPMEQAKLDKIRRVSERMDAQYWEDLAYQVSVFDARLQDKTDELTELLPNLIAAQCDVLNARSEGFKQILQAAANTANTAKNGKGSKTSAQETAINAIIAVNTAKLAELTETRQAALSELPGIFTAIQNIFDEAAKMGETFAIQPPINK